MQRIKRLALLLFIFTLSWLCARSQSVPEPLPQIDTTTDSGKADYYYTLSCNYWSKNADSVLQYAGRSLQAAKKAGYGKGLVNALLSEGVAYDWKAEQSTALDCYLQALRISERLRLDNLTANLNNNIGAVYANLEDYHRSTDYYRLALRMAQAAGEQRSMGILLANIADNFKQLGQYDSALDYNYRALPIIESIHDSMSLAGITLNIGEDYTRKGELTPAAGWLHRCAVIAGRIHDEEDGAWAAESMADVCRQQHRYRQSVQLALTALKSARRFSFAGVVRPCYSTLCSAYRDMHDYEHALAYRDLEVAWKDSLYNIEKEKKIAILQSQYEWEKQQHQIDLLKQKDLIQQKEVQSERERHFVFAGAALFFSLWAFFLFRTNGEMNRLNRRIRAESGVNPQSPGE